MFRSILVAIDGSPSAMRALEEGIALARDEHARLVLLSVAAPPRWVFAGPGSAVYPSSHDLEQEARAVVELAEAYVPDDIPVSSVVDPGCPADAIVARAEAGGHDLVIVGSRGRGFFGSLVLGSVSRRVIRRCPVPVLVAGRERRARLTALEPRRVAGARVQRSPAPASMQAEPSIRGGTAVFLWLVAALLAEIQIFVWMFDRMYVP